MPSTRPAHRSVGRSRYLAAVLSVLLVSTPNAVVAQERKPEFQLLSATMNGRFYGRINQTKLVDDRITVVESFLTVSDGDEFIPRTQQTFIVDCKAPRSVKLVYMSWNTSLDRSNPKWVGAKAEGVPENIDPRNLEFDTVDSYIATQRQVTKELAEKEASRPPAERVRFDLEDYHPHNVRLLAEYACLATAQPDRQVEIAKQLLQTGGLADMKELSCELKVSSKGTRPDQVLSGSLRFSESSGFVQWNDKWMSQPRISGGEIQGSLWGDVQLRVSRMTGTSQLISDKYGVVGSGTCDLPQNRPRKF